MSDGTGVGGVNGVLLSSYDVGCVLCIVSDGTCVGGVKGGMLA